jgi:nitric oxide reductase large subunit
MKAKMPLKIVAIMIAEKCGILGVTLEDAKVLLEIHSKNLTNAHKHLADFRY